MLTSTRLWVWRRKDTWGLLARQSSVICEPQVLVRDCLKKYSGQLLETNTKG